MIPYAPNPILFELGPVAIRYYSLAYLIGFLLAYVALRKSRYKEHADDITLWLMIGVIVGGRIGLFIFYSPSTFWTNPLEILYIWHGGMSFHGALIGSVLSVGLYLRKKRINFFEVADIITLPALAGIVLGRIANFLNGELVGTVTSVPWCMVFPGFEGCRHPSQLYEAAYTLVILLIIVGVMLWEKRNHSLRAGTKFAYFVILYGVFRFIANFWREETLFLGISTGQYLSLFMVLVGFTLLSIIYKREKKEEKHTKKGSKKNS